MSRAIVLDTETTGLEPGQGDRVLELAAIEIVNLIPTGREFHRVIDPEREVPEEATRVHGFTAEMLRGKPRFAEILPELLDFLGEDSIIAHNAPFDFAFLDAEFDRAGASRLDRGRMVDTLMLARQRFPGLPNSLDALCRRYGVDNSGRDKHNALLDVRLLAEVHLHLRGGRQPGLALAERRSLQQIATTEGPVSRTPRAIVPSESERKAHEAFVATRLKDALWLREG
jgi:DNA polymerase III subunit epsilon